MDPLLASRDLTDVILVCRVGSRAYGTATLESDHDTKGIFVPRKRRVYGIDDPEPSRQIDKDTLDYPLQHYARLCTKCLPNALELLFCEEEDVLYQTSAGRTLRDGRRLFLSQVAVGPYIEYAKRQLEKCVKFPQGRGVGRTELMERYGYDTKFAYHTIRLLQTAEELLTTGELRVRRPNGDFLIAVRNGHFGTYTEFQQFALQLIERIWTISSGLPEKPDVDVINAMVVALHELHWATTRQ